MEAKIKAISYVTPKNVLSNEKLIEEFPEWSVEGIASKVGISQRYVSSKEELSSDLAINAAKKLFKEHQIDKSQIDLIILCTQSPDYVLPTTACIVQNKLDLSTSCGAFDFNLGCSGYVYGLAIAKGFIVGGIAKNILLLTSETYTKYLSKDDKGNRTIFGDAATATLISTEGIANIEDFILGSDGSGAENLIVRNRASKVSPDYDNKLYMNGAEIFYFTLKAVPSMIKNILEKNELLIESIDLFILHQANTYMLNHLRKKMKINEDNFYIYMNKVGNTVSSTIPIAIYHAIEENRINKGDKVLLAGFGVGYSWGSTILNF